MLFPVPKSDRELESIRKDIDVFSEALRKYNDYIRYLAQKYDVNIREKGSYTSGIIILNEPELSEGKSIA